MNKKATLVIAIEKPVSKVLKKDLWERIIECTPDTCARVHEMETCFEVRLYNSVPAAWNIALKIKKEANKYHDLKVEIRQ